MVKKIQKFLSACCILFTFLVFALYGLGKLFSDFEVGLNLEKAAMLLGTCAILCLCSCVLFIKKLPMYVRILLHYLLVLGSMFLIFAVIGKIISTSLQSLVMLSAVTLLYSVIALVYALFQTRSGKKTTKKYTPIFKK